MKGNGKLLGKQNMTDKFWMLVASEGDGVSHLPHFHALLSVPSSADAQGLGRTIKQTWCKRPYTRSNSIKSYRYLSDRDIEMDLFGGKGKRSRARPDGAYDGGEGGYSRIRFTLEKKVEYIIGGMTNLINTPFVYKKAKLIAVVGAGGDASSYSPGGMGGGIGIAGGQAPSFGGVGGSTYSTGTLPANGIWSRVYQPSTGVYPEDQVVDSL